MKTILRIFISSTLFTTISFGDIINVPADVDSIQVGIDLANDGDTVLVDVGTYFENINFNGKNITVGSLFLITNDRSFISKTIIDGNQNYDSVVTFKTEEDTTSVLCGFTITNGVGGGGCGSMSSCVFWAGGITCWRASPTLSNLRITGNSGGGIDLSHSSPKLINVTITENSGGGIHIRGVSNPKFDNVSRCNIYSNYAVKGSDLYSENDTLTIEVVVDTFTVSSPSDFHAFPKNNFTFDLMNAKIEQTNSDLYVNPNGNNKNSGLSLEEPLKNMSFAMMKIMADSLNPHTIYLANGEYANDFIKGSPIGLPDYVTLSGESKSGVIFRSENSWPEIFSFTNSKGVSLENMTIIGNGETRGIICGNSNPIIKNVTLNGAKIWLMGSNPHIEKVKISGNTHESPILIEGSSPTLMNVEITDNSGWLAGGLRVEVGSHVNLINCTISGNNSTYVWPNTQENIGGIHIDSESTLNIINSIIWDNPLYEIGITKGRDLPSSSIMVTNSLLKGGRNGVHILGGSHNLYWLGGNIDVDPNFIDPSNVDYRLQEGSPCIDAGIQDTFLVYNDGKDTIFIPPMDYIGSAPDMGAYEFDPTSDVRIKPITPVKYSLKQNYPNPFNPSTTIEFTLPQTEFAELKVYNILGKEVATLVSNKLNQGNHTYQFDGKNLASGIYYYQLVAGEYREVRKMILLR